MRSAWIVGAVLGLLGPARAARAEEDPLAGALARHAAADVAALRARLPGDASVRCTLGAVYARRGDLSRAMLYLTGCADATLPDDLAGEISRAARATKQQVRASELSELQIITTPPGLIVELDALPDEQLTTPITVWINAGTHTVRTRVAGNPLQASITTRPYSRALLPLDATVPKAGSPRAGRVDFSEDNATESQAGPPPDIKRPSLIRGKYTGELGPRGPMIADPLAVRRRAGQRPWFGVRIGGGMYDDARATASLRPSVAAAARFLLVPNVFFAARLDWSRRGGAAATAIDTAGLALGAGTTLAASRSVALAAIGQLRGDLRFADAREMAQVHRAGVTAAAAIEVAFPTTPLTAGVRYEQGLTELVAGARGRALVVELGVDWR